MKSSAPACTKTENLEEDKENDSLCSVCRTSMIHYLLNPRFSVSTFAVEPVLEKVEAGLGGFGFIPVGTDDVSELLYCACAALLDGFKVWACEGSAAEFVFS